MVDPTIAQYVGDYIGEIYSASTNDSYIHLRLREDQQLEDFQLGDYLTVYGVRNKYLCKLVEITSKQLQTGLAESTVAIREIGFHGLRIGGEPSQLAGNPIFYDLILKPLKMYAIETNEVSEPQTIPPIFTQVLRTKNDDLKVLFKEQENAKYVTIGHIRGIMSDFPAEAKIELFRTQNLHAAIFAKTGSGKTVLAKILVGHMVATENSCAVIFDMHNEYGYRGIGTSGLKPFFPDLYVVSVDHDETEIDAHLTIPFSDLRVQDVLLSITLSPAQESTLYTLVDHYEDDWLSRLLNDKADNVNQILMDCGGVKDAKTDKISGGEVRAITLNTLRREIRTRITSLSCFQEKTTNAVDAIVSMILQGRSVVINFGKYSDDPMVYTLITNLVGRRIFEVYQHRIRDLAEKNLRQVSLVIEEAHKFLNKEHIRSAFFGRFIREARKFKMGLVLIDQRPSMIDEEVLSQIGTLFIMQLTNAKDLKALSDQTEEGIGEYLPEIKRLNPREGIVLGKGTDFVQNFRIFNYNDPKLLEQYWGLQAIKPKPYNDFN